MHASRKKAISSAGRAVGLHPTCIGSIPISPILSAGIV
jgi:hypothetical protein